MELINSKRLPTIDEILLHTNGGYDVYDRYYKTPKKLMKRPWGTDKHLSFSIFKKGNIWFWKDLAKEDSGNCIGFLEKLHNLTKDQAIERIANDFNLLNLKLEVIPERVYKERIDDELTPIRYKITPFTQKHLDYWLGVPEEFINSQNIYAISNFRIGNANIKIGKDELCFGYFKNNKEAKFYLPERPKGERFFGNIRNNYFFNSEQIGPVENLFIVKSKKDSIFFAYLGLATEVPMNESIQSFDQKTDERLRKKAKNIIIAFGTDQDGFDKSVAITKQYDYKWFNIPKKFLSLNITDFYEYIRDYNLNSFKKLLKTKKYL
jgi:hypothetical protein